MIRTQISVDESLYRSAKELARRKGVSLAELCRRSLARTVAEESAEKPWLRHAGLFDGGPDDSETVDETVYGRQTP